MKSNDYEGWNQHPTATCRLYLSNTHKFRLCLFCYSILFAQQAHKISQKLTKTAIESRIYQGTTNIETIRCNISLICVPHTFSFHYLSTLSLSIWTFFFIRFSFCIQTQNDPFNGDRSNKKQLASISSSKTFYAFGALRKRNVALIKIKQHTGKLFASIFTKATVI